MPPAPFVAQESAVPLEAWGDPSSATVTWRTLLSGDRTPTKGLTLGVAEVPADPDAAWRLHRHAQAEAYYILSGHGVLRIDGADHPLAPGTTAFIPGGTWHQARATQSETLRLLYVFAADSFSDVVYEFEDGAGDLSGRGP